VCEARDVTSVHPRALSPTSLTLTHDLPPELDSLLASLKACNHSTKLSSSMSRMTDVSHNRNASPSMGSSRLLLGGAGRSPPLHSLKLSTTLMRSRATSRAERTMNLKISPPSTIVHFDHPSS